MRHPRLWEALPLLACLLLASTAALADDWESYQHDPAHTGYTSASPSPTAMTLEWSAPTGYATPIIEGDSVIATLSGYDNSTDSTTVSSFQLNTGAVNWSYTIPTAAGGSPASQAAYGNGLVAVSTGINGTDQGDLVVLDAATGYLKYTVNLGFEANLPVLVPGSNGTTTAYVANGSTLDAVSLGANSGSILWSASGEFGGASIPTVVGNNTVVLASPGQYYAINASTGAINNFHSANIFGGGGDTVVFDAAHNELYVKDQYNQNTFALTAYSFGGNYNSITQLWQDTGSGIGNEGQVALDANGNVYTNDYSKLVEIDHNTGAILRSITGPEFTFNGSAPPLIAGNTLWSLGTQTDAYDLSTLDMIGSFPGDQGNQFSPEPGAGAVDDSHFIVALSGIDGPGLDVYAVPEPTMLGWIMLPLLLCAVRPNRRITAALASTNHFPPR